MYNSLIKSASRFLAVIEFFTHQYLEEKKKDCTCRDLAEMHVVNAPGCLLC